MDSIDLRRLRREAAEDAAHYFDSHLPPLIGFGGALAAGKDTVADYIVEHHEAVKVNMSAPLVAAMLALNPLVEHYIAGTNVEHVGTGSYIRYRELHEAIGYVAAKKNPEVRRLYQVLGTEVGRDLISENVWVDIASRTIQQHRAEGFPVVITGIRFENEQQMIRDLGGTLVYVTRGTEGTVGTHASETSVRREDFDVTIENLSTLEALYASAETLWTSVAPRRSQQWRTNLGESRWRKDGITGDAGFNEHGTTYDF
jgi:hypothetical protein